MNWSETFSVTDLLTREFSTPQQRFRSSSHLYVSSFGRCVREVMLKAANIPYDEGWQFPPRVRDVMSLGNAYEDDTAKHIKKLVGEGNFSTQDRLRNDIWSGKKDYDIKGIGPDPVTGEPRPLERPIIVEHKATGDKWWDYNASLPKREHVAQTWLYGELYHELHGVRPRLILFYRSWGHKAEFDITYDAVTSTVGVKGTIDGKQVNRSFLENYPGRRMLFESAFKMVKSGRPVFPPPPPGSPCDACGCTFKGAPSCSFYKTCWRMNAERKPEVVVTNTGS